jgi:hypothetical protein
MLAFGLAAQKNLVKLTLSEHALNLTAYATMTDRGHVWITLINKDLERAAAIELALPDGFSTATATRLAAPSAQSKTGVTLGGAPLTADGRWLPRENERIAVAHGTASFTVPAASAALVALAWD